jgi:hypothetical protein
MTEGNERYRAVSYDWPRKRADFRKAKKGLVPVGPSAGFRFVTVEPVTVGRYSGKVTSVYSVMSYANSDRASMDVHLSSMAPTSVERAYQKIWGAVKESNRPQRLGGGWPQKCGKNER